MGLIEINKNPTARDLKWFGVIVLVLSGLLGLGLWRATGHLAPSISVWTVSVVLVLVYYSAPSLQRPVFVGWLYLFYPLGWVMSHALLAAIYFGVITPIGLLMRLIGHDPLQRRFDRTASSYWVDHRPVADVKQYFRQF